MPKETTKKSTKAATTEAKKRTSRKESKAKKDPNAPKKPLSAYMFFSQDWRERVKTENPEAKFGEIGKILGAKWKELDEGEKKPYQAMAERDKKRYETDKANYEAEGAAAANAEEEEED